MSRLPIHSVLGFTAMICLAGLSIPVTASDLSDVRSEVKGSDHILCNPGTPDGRQGGEDIASAVVISALPFADTGNTCDNIDDYDEACPYTGATAPDVVYAYTPAYDDVINIDLCGSSYDTKLYVYCESEGNLVDCNDDYYFSEPCGVYVSFLNNVVLFAGLTYYIVIDGYGADCGDYEISIFNYLPCFVDCPPDAVLEGEPELVDGYIDNYNGGCNSTPPVFQLINWWNEDGCAWLCGISGWYQNGGSFRDTDWFEIVADDYSIDWSIDAEFEVHCAVIIPEWPCPGVLEIAYEFNAGPCAQTDFSWPTIPGEEYWLWVGPTTFDGPVYEFTYFMTVCGIHVDVLPARQTSLGRLKRMYR